MQDKRVCKISFPYSEKIKQTKLKRSTRGIKVSLWGIEPNWSIGYHIFRFVSIRIDLTRRLESGHGEKEVESISEFFLASVFIFDFHFRLDTKIKPHITKWFEQTNNSLYRGAILGGTSRHRLNSRMLVHGEGELARCIFGLVCIKARERERTKGTRALTVHLPGRIVGIEPSNAVYPHP